MIRPSSLSSRCIFPICLRSPRTTSWRYGGVGQLLVLRRFSGDIRHKQISDAPRRFWANLDEVLEVDLKGPEQVKEFVDRSAG